MIDIHVTSGVAVVEMARTPVNALDRAMRQGLINAFDDLSMRDDVRVIMLRSSQKVFSAGADTREKPEQSGINSRRSTQRLSRELVNAVREASKPVIAVMNGPAVGAGFALAAACDIILCSTAAEARLPEIDHGRIADVALIRSLFSRSTAASLLYSGTTITAAELYRLGIVSEVLPPESLESHAMALAKRLAEKDATTLRYTKLALNAVENMPLRDGYRFVQSLSDEV